MTKIENIEDIHINSILKSTVKKNLNSSPINYQKWTLVFEGNLCSHSYLKNGLNLKFHSATFRITAWISFAS